VSVALRKWRLGIREGKRKEPPGLFLKEKFVMFYPWQSWHHQPEHGLVLFLQHWEIFIRGVAAFGSSSSCLLILQLVMLFLHIVLLIFSENEQGVYC
jgi:hypothetical protein